MLRIENLQAGYGRVTALHDLTLEVGAGQVVSLLGANGAGKTTTLNCICGVVAARQGRIFFEDDDITGLPIERIVARGIVQVPEGRAIFRSMSVQENISLGAWCRRDSEAVRRDFERMLTWFPALHARLGQAAGTLSGGEQQMLMMARALLANPRLLLLDEPSLGLAPVLIEGIFDIIGRLREAGLSVLLVEQNARAALELSQYGYVLENGELMAQGSAAALAENDSIREAYLGGSGDHI
jgi:branched-chain amino acid transport system ATP-binding protein